MPPPPMIKPENVLKRAQELIAVNQQQAALTVLHEHVTSKRSRNSPITSLEPVMLLFVELCVDLSKGKSAKDGLYQYKNIAQNTNVGTIELVLKRFIELAEQKVTDAQAKAEQVQSSLDSAAAASVNNIDDLEATETPETILLATVSGEQSKDRTDRAIVTPWLKFLWETYRTVLEILKNNARLEILYQSTAHQAFRFCEKYTRKTEFRRLCELLRNHVQNAAKYSSQMHAINLNEPDTLQRHLETRFTQLNVADKLELWQEAFRSVEDIHMLLTLSKRPAKNTMMANYFEKLTKIFLVSDNFLFHAAAYSKYYTLLRTSAAAVAAGQPKKDNPVVSEAELTKIASFVLLSAIAIPVISTSRSRGIADVDEARKKTTRLTNLLNMPNSPTRAGLFKDAIAKGLLKRAAPEIRDLYNILEVDFHPLSICSKISPILTQIGQNEEMKQYVQPLQQVILTRLFQQLSQMYDEVKLDFVIQKAQFPEPFQVSPAYIEKFIMNGAKKGDLAIRLDHVSGKITFDHDVFSSAKASTAAEDAGSIKSLQNSTSEIARLSLTRLAQALHVFCEYEDDSYVNARLAMRESALARAAEGMEQEHIDTLQRKAIIEKKKEAASEAALRKAPQNREREVKRVMDEQARIRKQEIQKQLDELKGSMKIDLEDVDISTLDSNAVRMIKLTQLEKDKNEKDNRIRITAKRIDHLERAFRREELKHLPADYEKQREEDLKIYEEIKDQTLQEARQKHKEGLELKNRLGRLVKTYDAFKADITARRAQEFEKLRRKAERELEDEKKKRIKAHKEEKQRKREAEEAEERRRKEEEERRIREEEEKAAADAEKERLKAERRALLEKERAERDEAAKKQMLREEEAIARRAARKTEPPARDFSRPSEPPAREFSRPSAAAPMDTRTDSNERTAPRLNLTGRTTAAGGSWRERVAAKEASGGAPPPAAAAPEKYVPRHLQNPGSARPEAPPNGASGSRPVPTPIRDSGRSSSQAGSASGAAEEPRKPTSGASGKKYVPPGKRN
ncbi:hypothetical protein DV738_g3293, partial [Chaetothyriales sp. CBS 135597]